MLQQEKSWATPQASDHVEGARTAPTSNQKCLGRDLNRTCKQTSPKLNPNWVEQLMLGADYVGWTQLPIEWTDSAYLETESASIPVSSPSPHSITA